MVRWYIEAFDTDGHDSRWPLFQIQGPPDGRQSAEYLGTVVADPAVTSQLPIYQLFVQNPSAADTRSGTRASVFYDGEFYDNVFIRLRGGTTTRYAKKSHRINFNKGHYFRFDDEHERFGKVNLNAEYTDPVYFRSALAFEMFRDAGVPAPLSFPVRVEQNGDFYQLAMFVEALDDDFLERNGLNPEPMIHHVGTLTSGGPAELVNGISRNNADRAAFMFDNALIDKAIDPEKAFTNDFLP